MQGRHVICFYHVIVEISRLGVGGGQRKRLGIGMSPVDGECRKQRFSQLKRTCCWYWYACLFLQVRREARTAPSTPAQTYRMVSSGLVHDICRVWSHCVQLTCTDWKSFVDLQVQPPFSSADFRFAIELLSLMDKGTPATPSDPKHHHKTHGFRMCFLTKIMHLKKLK